MTGTDAAAIARTLLTDLQDAVAAKSVERLLDLFADDVVLFGTAAANLDRGATERYLEAVVAQEGIIRWEFHHVVTVVDAPGVISFAAVGSVGFVDEAGTPRGGRDPFRLTCVAVEQRDGWRLRHFHGSVPQP